MDRLDDFRTYYNRTIHPELLRMDHKRKRLLWEGVATALVLLFIGVYVVLLETFALLLLFAMILFMMGYRIRRRAAEFRAAFKPKVVQLVLDFIGEQTYQLDGGKPFTYEALGSIPQSTFNQSLLFDIIPHIYEGEDRIRGNLRGVPVDVCELTVEEIDRVDSGTDLVFQGVFVHAEFERHQQYAMVVLPRYKRSHMMRTIKKFTRRWAQEVEVSNSAFTERFVVYATENAPVNHLLPIEIQRILVKYAVQLKQDIHLSFIAANEVNRDGQPISDLYLALSSDKDILEPYIFDTNVSYDLVREFFLDLQTVFSIVEELDQHY